MTKLRTGPPFGALLVAITFGLAVLSSSATAATSDVVNLLRPLQAPAVAGEMIAPADLITAKMSTFAITYLPCNDQVTGMVTKPTEGLMALTIKPHPGLSPTGLATTAEQRAGPTMFLGLRAASFPLGSIFIDSPETTAGLAVSGAQAVLTGVEDMRAIADNTAAAPTFIDKIYATHQKTLRSGTAIGIVMAATTRTTFKFDLGTLGSAVPVISDGGSILGSAGGFV